MRFIGISRIFSTAGDRQYETIGAFWDELSAQYGRENLRGLGYNWQPDSIEYVIGLKERVIPGADCAVELPDEGWQTVSGHTEQLGELYEDIYADGPLSYEIECFTDAGECTVRYTRVKPARRLICRLPAPEHETILADYVREHHENGETSISASFGVSKHPYTEWLEAMRTAQITGNDFGRSLLFLCFDGSRLIGLLSVRYDMPKAFAEKYGHIGYGVRPSERRKGYATAMMQFALEVCREKKMPSVILGCFSTNSASEHTIRKAGGVLFAENENYRPGESSRYFRIDL